MVLDFVGERAVDQLDVRIVARTLRLSPHLVDACGLDGGEGTSGVGSSRPCPPRNTRVVSTVRSTRYSSLGTIFIIAPSASAAPSSSERTSQPAPRSSVKGNSVQRLWCEKLG